MYHTVSLDQYAIAIQFIKICVNNELSPFRYQMCLFIIIIIIIIILFLFFILLYITSSYHIVFSVSSSCLCLCSEFRLLRSVHYIEIARAFLDHLRLVLHPA